MRLLKSEFESRYTCCRDGGRVDTPMHPEKLYDFDILEWRDGRSYSSDKDGDPPCIDSARINDFDPPTRDVNDRVKKLSKISKLIHRTYT